MFARSPDPFLKEMETEQVLQIFQASLSAETYSWNNKWAKQFFSDVFEKDITKSRSSIVVSTGSRYWSVLQEDWTVYAERLVDIHLEC